MTAPWYSREFVSPVTTLAHGYNEVDDRLVWTPPEAGHAHLILYCKLRLKLKPGYWTGKIRRRADRAQTRTQPVDATAYEDITITNTSGEEFEWLINVAWDGEVWKGRSMTWLLNIGPEFASAKLVTRYAKAFYWGSA